MEPFETFEHAGCTIELHYDDDPMSPADWDTLGTLVVSRSLDWLPRGAEQMDGREEDARDRRRGLLARYLSFYFAGYVVPIRVANYGSGGLRIYEDADEPNAFLYTTPDRLRELSGDGLPYLSPQWARDALRAELNEWSAYVEGNVVGYIVRCGEMIIDSCWGFYPDRDGDGLEYVRQEARASAEYEQEQREYAANLDIATR